MPDEFYVGYAAKVPLEIARTTRRFIVALITFAIGACILLILAQQPFARASFEYQQPRDFAGTLESSPYPAILVQRPGGGDHYSRYLLVAPGKHGADVAGLAGQAVTLRGSLIYRGGLTMIELEPGSIKPQGGNLPARATESPSGEVTITGEIVDSKCYLGVMNPGRTKVRRDCAARCIRGGIPALLVTADATYLLTGTEAADFVGERVEVQGDLSSSAETSILRAKKISRRE